jgi:phosphatidylglycerol:prolipoprotein diacylglycerol transferase
MLKKNNSNDKIVMTYLISYSIFRFFNEFLRGDEVRGILWLDLSSSQWVSIFIILISIVYIVLRRKKPTKAL